MNTEIRTPDQSALLYRTNHLNATPATPGGTPKPVTELMHIHQYGAQIVTTIPHADLGGGARSDGIIQTHTYVDARVAFANFRAMVARHTQTDPEDGWIAADLTTYNPADPASLTPLTIGHTRTMETQP